MISNSSRKKRLDYSVVISRYLDNVQKAKHNWDAPGHLEDSVVSEDEATVVKYVPSGSGYTVKFLSTTEMRKALGVAKTILKAPLVSPLYIKRKKCKIKKENPYYKILKDETVKETEDTVALKSGKINLKIRFSHTKICQD